MCAKGVARLHLGRVRVKVRECAFARFPFHGAIDVP
jgi:hypothetical protein